MKGFKSLRRVEIALIVFQIVMAASQIAVGQIAVVNAASPEVDLEVRSVSVEAVLDPWGGLYFYESYSIRNIGKTSLRDITLRLPLNLEEVSAHDAGGQLDIAVKDSEDVKEVRVNLRYPLRGEEGAMTYHDACAFTVRYRMSSRPYLASTGSWLHYRLSIRLPAPLNLTFRSLTVRITLPEGARYQNSSYGGDVSTSGLTPSIDYVFNDVNPAHIPGLWVDYEYLSFWSALRPTIWIGGVTAVVGVLVLHRRSRRRPSPVVSDRSVKLIRSFTEICDERIMLWSDIDSLEESLDNRRITRKDYNRRKRIIQQRLRSLDNAFVSSKNEVGRIEPRYAELISKMERAEAEIMVIRDSVERLRAQYRSDRLSRRAYVELKDGYEKRVERAKGVIEGIIIELKGEV